MFTPEPQTELFVAAVKHMEKATRNVGAVVFYHAEFLKQQGRVCFLGGASPMVTYAAPWGGSRTSMGTIRAISARAGMKTKRCTAHVIPLRIA